MSDGIDISVEGLGSLFARLDALGGNAQEAVHTGLLNGAKVIMEEAVDYVPPTGTGQLAESITVVDHSDHEVAVFVGAEHGIYVEFGTGQRGDPSVPHRSDWKGMPAQPYLVPAAEENREEVHEQVRDALLQAIREVSAGD